MYAPVPGGSEQPLKKVLVLKDGQEREALLVDGGFNITNKRSGFGGCVVLFPDTGECATYVEAAVKRLPG